LAVKNHCFTVTGVSGNVTNVTTHATHLSAPEAAQALAVPEAALARWTCEFGFPTDVGTDGVARFPREQIEALHATLGASHSVEGAIREAQRRLGLTS
jgi:hypothetical protein